MATIADVAKLAGVSQGTVSNVLNGKGNVTSEKIHAVQKAAQTLGYTINERARILRKGRQDIIGLILPTVESLHYRELYKSIGFYGQMHGYSVRLFITSDNPQTELEMLQQAKSAMIQSVAVVSCLRGEQCVEAYREFEKVCYLERRPDPAGAYFGFDYAGIGAEIAGRIRRQSCRNVTFVSGSEHFWNEAELKRGFFSGLDPRKKPAVTVVETDMSKISHRALNILLSEQTEMVVVSNIGFAEVLKQVRDTFFPESTVTIYTLAPLSVIEEDGLRKYELNYNLLGAAAVRSIVAPQDGAPKTHIFEANGERSWNIPAGRAGGAKELNMLTLESPELDIVRGLARAYETRTGVKVNVMSAPYEELYEQLTNAEYSDVFDIFRLDVAWLSWFAERVLVPLDEIEPDIRDIFSGYLPAVADKYCMFRDRIFALPLTPSPQILFYRKDLFQDLENRRLYYEKNGRELRPPETFAEFNAIADFFTRRGGRKIYGNTLTVGNSAVATAEFLTRYFSHTDRLYDESGKIVLNHEIGRQALTELTEAQKSASPEPARWWTDSVKAFVDGHAAMMIVFANYTSEILRADSRMIGSIGYAMVPGGNPICGGGTVGIGKNSRAPGEALDFIKWLTTEPASSVMASLSSVSPSRGDYLVGENIRRFPWMELSQTCISVSTAKKAPEWGRNPFNEKRFDNIVGAAVKNVLAGLSTVDKALELAQYMLDRENG